MTEPRPTADEAEVGTLSDEYEAALIRNDVAAMDAAFWRSADVMRFGVAEIQFGYDDIAAWRATATPVGTDREILSRTVLELAPGVVAVDLTFRYRSSPTVGRQSQTWVRRPEGWRIVRAHVSMLPT